MTIRVKCPEGHSLIISEKFSGKKVKCPKCGSATLVPASEPDVEEDVLADETVQDSSTTEDEWLNDPYGYDESVGDYDGSAGEQRLPPRKKSTVRRRKPRKRPEPEPEPEPDLKAKIEAFVSENRNQVVLAGSLVLGVGLLLTGWILFGGSGSAPSDTAAANTGQDPGLETQTVAQDSAAPVRAPTADPNSATVARAPVANPNSAAGNSNIPRTQNPSSAAAYEVMTVADLIKPREWPLSVTKVDLKSRVVNVAVGGFGRWLVLDLGSMRELAVFDVNSGKITGHIPLNKSSFVFTAGADFLLVYYPQEGALERWSLESLKREDSAVIKLDGEFAGLTCGSGSSGPATMIAFREIVLRPSERAMLRPGEKAPVKYDTIVHTVDPRTLDVTPQYQEIPIPHTNRLHLSSSTSGKLIFGWSKPTDAAVAFWPRDGRKSYAATSAGYVAAGEYDDVYFCGTQVSQHENGKFSKDSSHVGLFFIPSHHGKEFLGIPIDRELPGYPLQLPARLYPSVGSEPLGWLPEIEYRKLTAIDHRFSMSLAKRVHVLPHAGVIVTIPRRADHLRVHRIDFESSKAPEPLSGKITRDVVDHGKQISALVVCPTGTGSGFCIHKDGYYATNEHVVSTVAIGDQVELVLDAGTANERVFTATVKKKNPITDLAIVKMDQPPNDLVAVEFSEWPQEKDSTVVIFGYPFGSKLAIKQKEYPNVSVNRATITAVRDRSLNRNALALKVQANPGNSGGPVLNSSGKLAGIIRTTIISGGISHAIPIVDLRDMYAEPEISFTPPDLTPDQLSSPIPVSVSVLTFLTAYDSLKVEFFTRIGSVGWLKTNLVPKQGEYQGKVDINSSPNRVLQLSPVRHGAPGPSPKWQVEDSEIKIGDQQVRLSELSEIINQGEPGARTTDGEWIPGSISSAAALYPSAMREGADFQWKHTSKITIEPFYPRVLPYKIVVVADGVEVATDNGIITVPAK